MTRPCSKTIVVSHPEFNLITIGYSPIRPSKYDAIIITYDELEAMRLKDKVGLHQMKIAKQMGTSQSTIHRILKSGRKKLIEAIISGKTVYFGGRR